MQRILILDRDYFIMSSLRTLLLKKGHQVSCVQSLFRAEELLKKNNFDLLICERNLTDGSTLELLEKIRERSSFLRVLVISQHKSLAERIEVLKLADDFLAKPLHLSELLLKIDNLLRLRKLGDLDRLENNQFLLRERNSLDQENFKLRPQELKILECLIKHRDMVISYDTITSYVWGYKEILPIKKTISVYIRRIRSKLPRESFQIMTYKNRGYKFIDLRAKYT